MKGKGPATESPINAKPSTYASKAAMGEQVIARSLEPRARSVAAWRAARERRNNSLRAAAISEVCIRRNRDRFQRLDNGGLEETPYPKLDSRTTECHNGRTANRILDAAPLFLGPHMVFALPWDPRFDSAKLDNCKVPVWVELPNIHPCFEAFGTQLLQSIGEVLFTSCEDTDCRFTSIRGCLKLDLSLDLPEAVKIVDPDTGEMFQQPVLYLSLPNACFHCHQRGHLVRNCPIHRQRRQQFAQKGDAGKMEKVEQQNKEQNQTEGTDFLPMRKPTDGLKMANPINSTNYFEVLAEEEPQKDEEVEEEPEPSRKSDGELAEPHQNIPGDEIVTDLDPQSLHVLPQEQSPVRMETTAEKRKRIPAEKGKGGGLETNGPIEAEILTPNGMPKSLISGQTLGNGAKRQGEERLLAKLELRCKEREALFCLRQLAEQGSFAVDYTEEGKAGTALIIRKNWRVLAEGRRGDGTAVWMRVRTEIGEIGFVSVHSPRDRIPTDAIELGFGVGFQKFVLKRILEADPISRSNAKSVNASTRHAWIVFTLADLNSGQENTSKPEIAEAVIKEWSRAGHQDGDARCQWELKWGAAREYLKQQQKEARNKETELQEKLLERQRKLREMAVNRAHMVSADGKELARRAQDEISSIVKDDGTRLEDDDSILEELRQYYQELYRQYPVSDEDEELRQRVLNLVHKRLTVAHNTGLTEVPTEEIGKVILTLKSEKAPGIDGMTAEVLRLLWRHVPGD
ncbi:hypothetical protein R1flu_026082 [Riccia fluitans]|uniref:CCHC-type domain-containing protein n=1 Tax=Riccia fluitans TaxID=41844 RepID=A0ABD1XEX4_9MARC